MIQLSKILIYLSLLSVILVSPILLFPFIVWKFVMFRFLIGSATILFLASILSGFIPKWERLKHPLTIAVSLFVAWLGVSTWTAFDSHIAFWSNFERGEGFLQFIFLYALFLISLLSFEKKDFIRGLWVSVIAMGGVIGYGILAHFSLVGVPSTIGAEVRFFGSLGNPIYFGAYSLFIFGFMAYLWNESTWKFLTRPVLGILGFIYFSFFWLAQARASFFGLVAGLLVVGMIGLYKRFGNYVFLGLAGILFTLLLIFGSFNHVIQEQKLSLLRVFSFDINSSSVSTRIFTWEAAIRGVIDRPLFGWGLENFSYVFDKYYDSRHLIPGQNSDTWYDRAHNVYLDYAVAGGIPALFAYLGILGVIIWLYVKKRFALPLLFIPIAYFTQGLAGFDVLPISIMLFYFLAVLSYETL